MNLSIQNCVKNNSSSDLTIDISKTIDEQIDSVEDIGFAKKIKKWIGSGRASRTSSINNMDSLS